VICKTLAAMDEKAIRRAALVTLRREISPNSWREPYASKANY
jgi:hypothetical protein